jgi:hypothetical protein
MVGVGKRAESGPLEPGPVPAHLRGPCRGPIHDGVWVLNISVIYPFMKTSPGASQPGSVSSGEQRFCKRVPGKSLSEHSFKLAVTDMSLEKPLLVFSSSRRWLL